MWLCAFCMDLHDINNYRCSTCLMPNGSTEHSVVRNHEPNTEDELTLSIGDVISVFQKEGETWKGKLGMHEGWFPKSCVDENVIKRKKHNIIKSVNEENTGYLKLEEGTKVTVINRNGYGEVWVVSGGKGGWIPETHIENDNSNKDSLHIDHKPIKQPQPLKQENVQDTRKRTNHLQKYKVVYDFEGEEIEIKEGDIVVVFGEENDGWLFAQIGYDKGLVPATHVQLLENQDEEILCVTANYTGVEIGELSLQKGDIVRAVSRRYPGWVWVNHNQTEGWYPENHLKHYDDFSEIDDSTSKPHTVPEQRQISKPPTMTESEDFTANTNRNTDSDIDEPTSTIPLSERQQITPHSTITEVYSRNTHRKANSHNDEPSSTSPIFPERQHMTQSSLLTESNDLGTNAYRNKETPAVKTSIKEPSKKPAVPKRPPPPSRPPRPQTEELTPICKDKNTEQMTNLYGRREENEVRLVMVGRTGSGKSATGNTIMAKADHFESKLAGGSVTRECKRGECTQAGRKLVLVDTPGLFDTKLPFEQISKEIIRCVNMSTPGPHVFLLVIQIARFTEEEIETFNRLFDLFGAEMGKFAIITFTKLDDLETEKSTIEAYIQLAPEKLKEFLNRCNGRYIAIDNKASEKKKSVKVKSLIQLIDSIVNKNGGKCYTNDMYKEAEAALQRKIKKVEDERAREKKKEIEQIQSTYVHKMNSITKENNKLAQQVRSNKESQRQVKKEKDRAQQDCHRMADEMKKIDKKHNQELYQIKKKEKEDKEKQAKLLEEKEKQQIQFEKSMEQRQIDMDQKYQNMERQKELQLAKVAEDHNKIMAAEMQRILDGNNLKYDEMMKVMEEKNKAYDKLQEKMAHQHTLMNEQMRERDKEFHKLEKEHRKRMEEERDRANETLKRQLEDQKQSIEATTKALLQEQREMDKTKRNDQEKANNKAYNKLQQQLAQQNSTLENMMREKDLQAQKQQEEHKKQLQDEKEKRSFQDRENEIQRQEFYKLEKEHRKQMEEERDKANETLKMQLKAQKQSIEATTKALLQEQRDMDKAKRSDQDEANNKAYNKLQEQLAQQNASMQKLINHQHESEKRISEEKEKARMQQEQHKRYMDANTESIIREQNERDKRQREERQREMINLEEKQDLKRQNEKMQEKIKQQEEACLLS